METAHLPNGTLLQGGRYKIVRFIGSGGFGCTYEGEHTMLGSKVAIKEFFVKDFCDRDNSTSHITVSTSGKKELVDKLKGKFVEEARATARMQHPNIVKVHDVFEENGAAYYVMDYIEGTSLEKLVKENGPLPEQTALKYIRQVADALGYVHSLNRLHLDLKPGNIMIDGHGNAVLVDFGASKQYDEAGGENTSTLIGKTPGYAPIEQMGNTVTTFSPATDIYALGATLYKLLTGVTPPGSTLLASGEELPPLPSNISASTANAVSAAMKIARKDRPQSVAEFLVLLDSAKASAKKSAKNSKATSIIANEETVFEDNSKKSEAPDSHPLWKEPISEPKHEPTQAQKIKSRNNRVLAIIFGVLAVIFGIIVLIDSWTPRIYNVPSSGQANGHYYVDLGLSVKWATNNVGASVPSGYGNYYAWGETKTKDEFTEATSTTYNKNISDIAGDAKYDAAQANWGGTWRLPTYNEMDELYYNCEWKWRKFDGKKGFLVTGPNGNSIFLPAAGYRSIRRHISEDRCGQYWCSTPNKDQKYSSSLYFYKTFLGKDIDIWRSAYRYYGYSIRPVLGKTITTSTTSQTSTQTSTSSTATNSTSSAASSSGSTTTQQGSNQTTAQTSSSSSTANKTSNSTSSSGGSTHRGPFEIGDIMGGSSSSTSSTSPTTSTPSKSSVPANVILGHEYVDLGLSVKWATCNVGASHPSDYGNYYAWGETRTKSEYTTTNCVMYNKKMGSIAGNSQYDVARSIWGGTWRLPTEVELEELLSKCTLKIVKLNGHKGYKVTGPNGNSIFLPAAGWWLGSSLRYADERGGYWCATPDDDNANYAYCLLNESLLHIYCNSRAFGRSVRPVSN